MSMRLHQANPSKLLRSSGAGRCRYCGLPVEWYERHDKERVPLMPEVPSNRVPQAYQWHVNQGVAYPGTDPHAPEYCRIPHPAVCPALEHSHLPAELAGLVTELGKRMQSRITRGQFTAPPDEEQPRGPESRTPAARDTARHVLHCAQTLRLAPGRIEEVRCIAQIDDGQRCPEPVFAAEEGAWEQIDLPRVPGREGQTLFSLGDGKMWVWSLDNATFATVSRWLNQRCPHHEDETATSDHTDREWETFHPGRHSAHILTARPDGYEAPAPESEIQPEKRRRECAADACRNGADWPVPKGWKCWRCTKADRRRALTERRWCDLERWPRPSR
ncbi:DUF6083 domain-containing protein [Streptomyces sp. NBC_01186]|uniref:DUF6083 domain-containing protein n=1 Tax=unclassified Streptomyces TaxID=2593676 RepID=UPI002DDA2F98|nr:MULTISPECIES: DUF6083 domain-containing protein [unclassified Streptomyces]WSB74386.1 DUF6083 domain-containing protein [Streptomyces sp. NBC_01775]WSS17233.1 DUF6083 domain-containing protein [Streptomyces sp. NBC_01186]